MGFIRHFIILFLVLSTQIAYGFDACSYHLTRRLTSEESLQYVKLRKQLDQAIRDKDDQVRVGLISEILTLRKVDHTVLDNGRAISITPNDASGLNRYAKMLYEEMGKTKLKYDPRQTVDSDGLFFTPIATVFMSESFFKFPRKTAALDHEVAHAAFNHQAAIGESSLFHGDFFATSDEIKLSSSSMYSDYLSLEELYTYPISLKQNLATHESAPVVYSTAREGLRVAVALNKLTGDMLRFIKRSPASVKYKVTRITNNYADKYDAVMVSIEKDGVQLDIPFVDKSAVSLVRAGKNEARPYILKRLKAQLKELHRRTEEDLPLYMKYESIARRAHDTNSDLTPSEIKKLTGIAGQL